MVSVLLVAAALCLGAVGPGGVEGTWWVEPAPSLPLLKLPEVCGARVFVGNRTTSEEDDGAHLNLTDSPWPWVVRVGDNAVGVLLSQQHVVTLSHCILEYAAWYGGFYDFHIQVGEETVRVADIRVQDDDVEFPLALLTLSTNLTWIPTTVCVGAMEDGLLAAIVGWSDEDLLTEEPLNLHRGDQCRVFEGYLDELMICAAPGPADCGAPLLQANNGRWIHIGLGVGDTSPVARYVRLEPSREWLETP